MKGRRNLLIAVIVLCLISLTGCALRNEHDTVRVMCYGDSNTYGFDPSNAGARYSEELIWTSIVQQKLGSGYTVINEGKNGRTTAYDVPGKKGRNGLTSLPKCLIENAPLDIVVFMLGTNECSSNVNIPLEDIGKGMTALIRETRERCVELQGYEPEILVIGPPPILSDFHGTVYEDQLAEELIERSANVAPMYEKIAAENNCKFMYCPDSAERSALDCLHFTQQGHCIMAEAVYQCLQDIEIARTMEE